MENQQNGASKKAHQHHRRRQRRSADAVCQSNWLKISEDGRFGITQFWVKTNAAGGGTNAAVVGSEQKLNRSSSSKKKAKFYANSANLRLASPFDWKRANGPAEFGQKERRGEAFYRPPAGDKNPIWSIGLGAEPSSVQPANGSVVLRKPRARRLLQTLLCCLGASPTQQGTIRGQLYPSSATDGAIKGPLSCREGDRLALQMTPSPKNLVSVLLPAIRPCDANKKCLVIDLDETLVHSSFKPVKNPDFVIPVEIEGVTHQVYVLKRPHVDEFLRRIGSIFECILFTASLAKYADPVADLLDKWGVFRGRLFREACVYHNGNYVKDLNRLGRDLKHVVIVDNSPASYAFHPDNAIPVSSWFDDVSDRELLDVLPLMERVSKADNIYTGLLGPPSAPPEGEISQE